MVSLDRLAGSLRELGMLNKPLVELVGKDELLEYIESWPESRLKSSYIPKVRKSEDKVPLVVVGHRRWLAALRAGYSSLDCFVVPRRLSLIERRILQVNENIYTPLPPWMKAKAVVDFFYLAQELRQGNGKGPYTKSELSIDTGIAESTVGDYFRFIEKLEPAIRDAVEAERIGFGEGLELARLKRERQLAAFVRFEEGEIKDLHTYVNGCLSDDVSFELSAPSSSYTGKLGYTRRLFEECERVMRIGHLLADVEEQPEFLGVFERFYSEFERFSKEVINISGKRRVFRSRQIRRHERFEKLIEESLELNSQNQLEEQPDFKEYVRTIPLEMIDFDENNPRSKFKQEDLEELADSIYECGLINPIHLRLKPDGKYRVDHGNSRLHSHWLLWEGGRLKEKVIAAYVLDELPEKAVFRLKLDENSQQPPNSSEEAECLDRLYKDMRLEGVVESVAGFSRMVGRSESKVRRALSFEESLSPEVKRLVQDGLLSYSSALALSRLEEKEQEELALTAVFNDMGYNRVREEAQSKLRSRGQLRLFPDEEFEGAREVFERRTIQHLASRMDSIIFMLKIMDREEIAKETAKDKALRGAFWRLYDTSAQVYNNLNPGEKGR